jgi:hypothetical protein
MSPIARILAASAALIAATAGIASAQDYKAQATYGSANLTSGFQPDPHDVSVVSGGTVNVAQTLGNNCTGFVANAPDFDLTFTAGAAGYPLIISVTSTADTTLVINGPDGQWYCDDDSGEGNNPSVRFNAPASGLYDIWIGTYGGASNISSTLTISEGMSR